MISSFLSSAPLRVSLSLSKKPHAKAAKAAKSLASSIPPRPQRALREALQSLLLLTLLIAPLTRASDEFLDRLDTALTFTTADARVRTHLSGTLELEGYALPQPSPGLLYTSGHALFNPRLTLFLDAQLGPRAYLFVQARADRGFDPAATALELRLDEYALRLSLLPDAHLHLQIGKFATVVGNWVARHNAWTNPFITAPLPYENLTAIWDTAAPRNPIQFLNWSHQRPNSTSGSEQAEKILRTPLIWGPSYTHGAALAGITGRFDYAAELKSAALSSHPDDWSAGRARWSHPTVSARAGFRPDARWNLGLSASTGPYLRASAVATFAPGRGLADYRQTVLAADLGFAWHHWQLWSEIFTARFAIPRIGPADTTAYYAEAKYRFTPRFSGALRWNQQLFATIPDGRGARAAWGREVWRLDAAPMWRFTAHTQFKLQYSLCHDPVPAQPATTHLAAAQLTLRFCNQFRPSLRGAQRRRNPA